VRFLADERFYANTEACLRFLRGLPRGTGAAVSDTPERYHLYWYGPFSLKQAFTVKSFLATQALDKCELWLWLDRDAGYDDHDENPYLRPLRPFLAVKRFDPVVEARDTPLEGMPAFHRTTPTERSNLVRHLVLYKYGGVYADMDTMFLRDMRVLRRHQWFAGDFCYRWSAQRRYGNTAVLALAKGGETALALLKRCAATRTCHPRTVLDFDANRDLDLLVAPCVAFDPLWPHHDHEDEYAGAPFRRFGEFFRRFGRRFPRPSIQSHREFFPGAFTYHWHNCWGAREHEDSYFGLFNAAFDHVLGERLGDQPASPRGTSP
jgi:hypothetical protein